MFLFGSIGAQAQDSVEVKTALCGSCRIAIQWKTRLRDADRALTMPYSSLAVGVDGSVLMGSVLTGGSVARFTADGHFDRFIGRSGAGPGELRHVTGVAFGPGDTIFALDGLSRWLHRLTPNGDFIDRTLVPGGIHNWLPLGGHLLFASATVPTRRAVGYPLHVINRRGIVASFGQEANLFGKRAIARLIRPVAPAADGRVWVADRFSYRIELWSPRGERVRVLTRDVDWFPKDRGPSPLVPQLARPPTRIAGLHDAGDGYLWVFLLTADANWKPEALLPGPVPGMPVPRSPVLDPFFDTVIEVIDLRRNVVVSAVRSGRMFTPVPRGYLASYEVDDVGHPIYTVWRPRLNIPPTR
ncbi:MAG: hypothetical protein WEE89_12560 [Gemmatimonadota bacterium]